MLERTGPVSFTVWINGNRLETYRLEKSQETRVEKPVPASWLKTGEATRVVLEPDKVKIGFSLYRAGFVE